MKKLNQQHWQSYKRIKQPQIIAVLLLAFVLMACGAENSPGPASPVLNTPTVQAPTIGTQSSPGPIGSAFSITPTLQAMQATATSRANTSSSQTSIQLKGQLQKQYKIETASITASTVISANSPLLPFPPEDFAYQVVVTITVGIDTGAIKDSDIQIAGDKLSIKLPAPQVLTVEQSGKLISPSKDTVSFLNANQNLVSSIQEEGKKQIVDSILKQGKLMQQARTNAEDEFKSLIQQLGFKEVVFV